MRKIKMLLALMLCIMAQGMYAQSTPFEGEIVYETYENYSDYLLKMANSIYFNGVHKMRMIVKGEKIHVIDETTGINILADAGKKTFVHYFEPTKTGLDVTSNVEAMLVLINRDINYSRVVGKLKEYTFGKKDKTVDILGHNCALYEGKIVREMGGIDQTYDVKAYVTNDLTAPAGLMYNLMGLELPNIPMKWIWKYDGGHVGFGVGELSMYLEADVIEVKPRTVNDDEFMPPTNYKISTKAMNAFALMKYYKGVKAQMEKMGIKGADNNQKTSGVHYKTEGEWGF